MKFVKSPAVPGFFLASMLLRGLQCASFSHPVFLRGAVPALCTNAGTMHLRLVTNSIVAADRPRSFFKHQPRLRQRTRRDRGLPSINAQKKVRLFSHLSA
jgi:hypothetical protein